MNGKAKVLLNIFHSPFITIRIFNVTQVVGVCRYLSQFPNHATSQSRAEKEKNLFLCAQTWVSNLERHANGSASSKPNYLGRGGKRRCMRSQEKPEIGQGTNRIIMVNTWEELDGSVIVAGGQVP